MTTSEGSTLGYRGKHRHGGARRRVLRAVAFSTALVLVALVGTAWFTYRHLEGNINVSDGFDRITEPRPETVEVEGPKEPLNVLVLGSDTRAGQEGVYGETEGLSDTTILLHLSADRERAYGVSIPRDLMVSRPPCTDKATGELAPGVAVDQWNEAYALGGEACTVAQFEAMSDLRVDHFVVVDFNGFRSMVDALGGVEVCVPREVDDPVGNIHLPAGTYEVTGDQALDYVRVRHQISQNGDIGRMRRQQAFLASMVNKAVSTGTLLNPPRLLRFLDAATESLTTDPGLGRLSELFDLAQEVRGIGLDNVQFFTVPITEYAPDPNRLALGEDADLLWDQLRSDRVLSTRFTSGAATASRPSPGAQPTGGATAGGGAGGGQGSPAPATPTPDPEREADAAANGLCA